MTNELIFILDGTTYPGAVVDDTKLKTVLQRDSRLYGFLESQNADVIFIGAAYDYLKGLFFDNTNGFCTLVDVEIQENCNGQISTLYNGIIKTSDITFDHKECTAKTKIYDNSFFALIDNNRAVDVDIAGSNRTKNGEVITAIDLYDVAMFDPQNGAALADCKCYRIMDVLQFILSWISDNEITLQSNLLDTSSMMITTGAAIKTLGDDPSIVLNFEDVINELNKKYRIGFKMGVDTSNNITFILESADDFFTTDNILNANDVINVITKADKKSLFAAVKVGSEITEDGPVYAFPENANYYGFKVEQFQSTGQCNNDTVVDLVSKWGYSSNAIEAQLTGSDDFDDNIFVIESENIDTALFTANAIANSLPNYSATERYYNIGFNNIAVVRNLYGFIHGQLIGASIQPPDRFRAYMTNFYVFTNNPGALPAPNFCQMYFVDYNNLTLYPLPTTYCDDPFPFDNETNDPNNNYDPVAYEYIVPSDGLYNFHVSLSTIMSLNIPWPSCAHARLYVEFVLMDTTSTITKEIQLNTWRWDAPGGPTQVDFNATFNCVATDRVHVRMFCVYYVDSVGCLPNTQPSNFELVIQPLFSYFEMTGGFLFNEVNQSKVITHEFDYPVTGDEFRAIQANPDGLVTIKSFDDQFTGWIERAEYEHWTNSIKMKIKNLN